MHIYHKQCEFMQKNSMKRLKRPNSLLLHGKSAPRAVVKTWNIEWLSQWQGHLLSCLWTAKKKVKQKHQCQNSIFTGARGRSWGWQWTSNSPTETYWARTKPAFWTKFAFQTIPENDIKYNYVVFYLLLSASQIDDHRRDAFRDPIPSNPSTFEPVYTETFKLVCGSLL